MTSSDVIIVGGGLVGAALAVALGSHGITVTVLEAQFHDVNTSHPSYDDRTVALSLGSRHILEALQVWPLLRDATPIRKIHVTDRGHWGSVRLDARSEGLAELGYVVENRLLAQALLQRLRDLNTVTYISGVRVRAVSIHGAAAQVTLEDGRELMASLVVAADGGQSAVREQLGFTVHTRDYQQSAIIANVTPSHKPSGVAHERFTAEGPLALLPMSAARYAMVWTVSHQRVSSLSSLSDPAFLQAVQTAFGWRVGAFQQVGRRHVFPLQLITVPNQVRARAVLLGNAAHTLHPIAGQGLNLCLRDVIALADVLVVGRQQSRDLGDVEMLYQYERGRLGDQRASICFTHGLAQLFVQRAVPVVCARDMGLVALDSFPPLRRLLTRHAMGLRGRLSRVFTA